MIAEVTTELIEQAALARLSFRAYTKLAYGWEPRVHQEPWWSAFQALGDGTLTTGTWVNGVAQTPKEEREPTNKLAIISFPESGKSDTANEWAAWMIGRSLMKGHIPQCGIVSYGDDVAKDRSVAIRDFVGQDEAYKLIFSRDGQALAVPAPGKGWAGHEWFLHRDDLGKKDPTMRAAGINGGIWAYRMPTFIILDDPHDIRSIESQTEKDRVWNTWASTIRSRAREKTPIVLICTRWADDDLAGRLMEVEGDWCVIRTTALVPELEEDLEAGQEQVSAWPPEELTAGEIVGTSTEGLFRYQRSMQEYFETQYMARPPHLKGDLFKWWTFGPHPGLQQVDRVYQFWDTAFNETKRSAYNVMTQFLKLKNGQAYLEYVYREKLEFPSLLTKCRDLFLEAEGIYGEGNVVSVVEGKASGQSLVQMLSTVINIKKRDIPRQDLVDRAKIISVHFEVGHIILPEEWQPWKDTYMKELKSFPRVRWKDQVAATVLGVEYMYPRTARGRPRPWGELAFVRN